MSDKRANPALWRLYVITDEQLSRGRTHAEIARAAVQGGADVIQLRDKTVSSKTLFETALAIRQLTKDAGVAFIVNDRLDIALAVDADGLHIGQQDLPAPAARKLLGPDKILGVSATNPAEAIRAETQGADYIGVGPIFEARTTKADAGEPRGLRLLQKIRRKCSVPITAIGGIKHDNAARAILAGADNLAVISAIVSADDIAAACRDMLKVIENGFRNKSL